MGVFTSASSTALGMPFEQRGPRFHDSMHQTDLVDTLIYCDLAGHRPDAVVIGMEPADYHTMEIGLTPVCQARLPDLAGKVVEELRARGVIA